ncbi:binding-protein-dependent transport system inner membrane protein [Nitratireductor aquibiodomus RA22]|uniref:Binding-protein-dependent transport system inner membrane protein n=1 Tax=Nitratireductor aquibiodomus RA22 TaxID=1189611 RepID=I5BUI5_9HYPH|nr:ABC transporter permease [Nitratireductor aquibiodomus]EIM73237.1 binding-protein-dependent transport system inner membrane protein [Nitratireductor aquibiodomus RA22]
MRHRLFDNTSRTLIMGIPILWIVLFMLLPYGVLLTYSFWLKKYPLFVPAFQFGNYVTLFTDPQYMQVLLRTLKIAALVSGASLLLAYPFAYFIVFRLQSARWRTVLFMAVIAPLWVSYLLRAYVWKTILGTEGILNTALIGLGIVDAPVDAFLYSQFAMVITLTYIFIPFMVMPIYAALEKIPRNLDEASADLGMSAIQTFFRVTVPLSMPGIVAGFTMTFCLSFGDFIAPFLVGGPDGLMVANVITSQFGSALNWPLGSALAVVMLILVLAIISVSDWIEQSGQVEL